jgi:2-polyprenyl-3-methyl-5-hydroxy-6-metoxy-1,4-benzoquinol methylase
MLVWFSNPTINHGMNLEKISQNWISLGNQDPMWAVLADPEKKGNRWEKGEFFETGRQEIKQIFDELRSAGVLVGRSKALDFGCGVGRLTQALAEYFESVDGVDIAGSMINKAQQFNRFPDRVVYHLNVCGDLSLFPPNQYDFICSLIVLQHMPRALQQNYIHDFFRLLKPGGIAYFQAIHTQGWRQFVPDWAAEFYRKLKHRGKPFIPFYGIQTDNVYEIVKGAGATIEKQNSTPYTDHPSRFKSDVYCVKKQA